MPGCLCCGGGTLPVTCDNCMKGADVPSLTFRWRFSTATSTTSPVVDGETTITAAITWRGAWWTSAPQPYPWHYWGLGNYGGSPLMEPPDPSGPNPVWVVLGLKCTSFISGGATLLSWQASAVGRTNAFKNADSFCGTANAGAGCQDITCGGFYGGNVGTSPYSCSPFHYYYYNINAAGRFDEMEITQ